jgi:hypothetical protein
VLSKKNGKTSLFAALALWHAITTAFADVAILAASRDQAGKLLQQLTGYIKRSPALREQLRITQRLVHCDRSDGRVAVLASDSDTLDGWGGTLAPPPAPPQVGGELRPPARRARAAEWAAGRLRPPATTRSRHRRLRARAREMDGFTPTPTTRSTRRPGPGLHLPRMVARSRRRRRRPRAGGAGKPGLLARRGRAAGAQGLALDAGGSGSALPADCGWPARTRR